MIMTHAEITARIALGMVAFHDDTLMNGTSLDVRLANVFKPEAPGAEVGEDEVAMLNLGQREPINTTRVELEYPQPGEDEPEPFLLYPGQFVLAATMERFRLPLDVSAEFRLKSSVGRMALSHALAVWCDPGYDGHLTLELHNISQHHVLALRAGDRVGQMIFHQHDAVRAGFDYSKRGHYNGDTEPQAARPAE